ncbi:hypothetical protein [Streptococcus cristatus]|uniref:hypothetical protein n=1 Tax=Streptococcus cristatus TaxID=45634 RepID=UPI0022838850|nr:hypothetical protein [Streptococcus cristatus]MCY7217839.1 hypothetical protein [Streptococcus cristatus]
MTLLLTGDLNYFSEESLLEAFPEERLFILGNLAKPLKKIRHLPLDDSTDLQLLFRTYDINQIIYFSASLNAISEMNTEMYQLRRVLDNLKASASLRFLYVTGPDRHYQNDSSRRIILSSAEELCQYYARTYHFSFKIIHSLHLYNLLDEEDSLGQLLSKLKHGKAVDFKVNPNQRAYYIYPKDLLVLCYRVLDCWDDEFECLSIPDSFHITYAELFSKLDLAGADIFSDALPIRELQVADTSLREHYGWFPKVTILDDLEDFVYQTQEKKDLPRWRQLLMLLHSQNIYGRFLQFFLLFAMSEVLSYTLGQQVYFKTVDYRLFFIMATAFILGTKMGLLAAVLATVGLLTQNVISGSSNLSTLFFEPSNWIPYMVYFISAMISGYVKEKGQDELASLKSENTDLRQQLEAEKYFIDDLLTEKAELSYQILGRQDSYGKIYRFLEHLDTPYLDIFVVRLLQYLSEIFQTESISIYSVQQGRLDKLQFSLAVSAAQPRDMDKVAAIFTHIEEEGIWVNQHLRQAYPMYMSALTANGNMDYCIFIEDVSAERLNLYHKNLFKVLMGLANRSYQQQLTNHRLLENNGRQSELVLSESDFYHKLLQIKEMDSSYFNVQILHLAVADNLPSALVQLLVPKWSMFATIGLIHDDYYLLYNARAADSLSDWREYLTQRGVEIVGIQNLEETIEIIQFSQDLS